MRRGQFYDEPDVKSRRSGSNDMFSTNNSTDYEDHKTAVDSKPLAESWSKSQDTRKYAETLSRYNPGRKMNVQQYEGQEPDHVRERPSPVKEWFPPVRERPTPVRERPTPVSERPTPFRERPTSVKERPTPVREQYTQAPPKEIHLKPTSVSPIISIVPNLLMPTVSWRSGSSKILMRNFKPLQDSVTTEKHPGRAETLFPMRPTRPPLISILNPKEMSKGLYIDGTMKDYDENFMPMRVWATTLRPVIPDEPEDIDEDNIVYKPV